MSKLSSLPNNTSASISAVREDSKSSIPLIAASDLARSVPNFLASAAAFFNPPGNFLVDNAVAAEAVATSSNIVAPLKNTPLARLKLAVKPKVSSDISFNDLPLIAACLNKPAAASAPRPILVEIPKTYLEVS